MLKSLVIKNYALIRELEMSPLKGFNIITGETGAGKSIMLGAIGLLLGNRAETKILFDENEKCVIEGSFSVEEYNLKEIFDQEELDYDNYCTIRREISPQNKSRAFINDTPVNLDALRKIGSRLMDIHSQHDTLELATGEFQTNLVDACAGNHKLLNAYKEFFYKHRKLSASLDQLIQQAAGAKKEFDYNSFLLKELKDLKLQAGEQEQLEEELRLLDNAEDIKGRLNFVLQALDQQDNSVVSTVQAVFKNLEAISGFSEKFADLKERIDSVLIELKDVICEVEKEEQVIEFSPERITEVRDRLSRIYQIQQKHQVKTVEELLAIQQELEFKVGQVDNLEEEIEKRRAEIGQVFEKVKSKAGEITEARLKVKDGIRDQLLTLLKEAGMPNATCEIKVEPVEPGPSGADKVTLLFSANKGVAPQELKNAASGGEFSRLMLCLKYILASKTSLPVIIFDEIDTGISGEIAIKVGRMMKQMAKSHQIIAISHLPQTAALGDAHYFVYKDDTSARAVSKIRKLADDERIMQIARMIGGENPTQSAIQNAKELMEL
jgi:DNA repair protein RecN (Recombination protein N)